MDKINCMQAFCCVVEEGSFSAAGRKMGVSKVLISRHVASLEDDLNIRLLHRTTRKMSVTSDGKMYYEQCVRLLKDYHALDDFIKGRHKFAQGRFKIAVPSESFTDYYLMPTLTQFLNEYSQIQLDIDISDQYKDIVGEGFDLAIRIGELDDSTLIAKKIADTKLILCASTRYLEDHETISNPSMLADHSIIADSNLRNTQHWRLMKDDKTFDVKTLSRVSVNSSLVVSSCLKRDLGIGICPYFMVHKEIESGDLVTILPEWELKTCAIYVIYSHRKNLSAKVNLFVKTLTENFEGVTF